MIRVIDKEGVELFKTGLTGLELQKWYYKFLEIGNDRRVASYSSLIASCGNLVSVTLSTEIKYVVEIVARRHNYLVGWHVKPFFCVDEIDGTTIIFLDYDLSKEDGNALYGMSKM
jgi:hypothetical protein